MRCLLRARAARRSMRAAITVFAVGVEPRQRFQRARRPPA